MKFAFAVAAFSCVVVTTWVEAQHVESTVRLATTPALSPDGSRLAFAWLGDVWIVNSAGGVAQRRTQGAGVSHHPAFSPDGKRLAFTSDRTGTSQVYIMPVRGGVPEQLTFHSEGTEVVEWTADGESLVVEGLRDHYWRRANRFFTIAAQPRSAEQVLFDAYGDEGTLSPDGRRVLFTREGVAWWRKGYYGSQAAQIWLFDRSSGEFEKVAEHPLGCRWPMWHPGGDKYYYVSQQDGTHNLWLGDLNTGERRQLTHWEDDGVLWPCISRDGSTIVFRRRFDLYRFRPEDQAPPERIAVSIRGDGYLSPTIRRTLDRADAAAFASDGLEVAVLAGGDVWVMDTTLREPVQVTATAEQESDVIFGPNNESLLLIADRDGQCDIWRARRADESLYWWQQTDFHFDRLTEDREVERGLSLSPTGEYVAFIRGSGDLWVMKPDGKEARRVVESWNMSSYDWSPDGRWLAFTMSNHNFVQNVYIAPVDGSREPFNVSMHPDRDSSPAWSPDGKILAFAGRRLSQDDDIYLVHLQAEDDEQTRRDRQEREALDKMQRLRRDRPATPSDPSGKPDGEPHKTDGKAAPAAKPSTPAARPEVRIDFENIVARIRRVAVADTDVAALFWSHDSKRLAFTATIEGRRGVYTIEPPDNLRPRFLTETVGSGSAWISQGNQILTLASGVPTSIDTTSGRATPYSFSAAHEADRMARNEVAFDLAWRTVRDSFYDHHLNNLNWNAIRRKYLDAARLAHDAPQFAQVMHMMLGELNASHLGFRSSTASTGSTGEWSAQTVHFGLRFDPDHRGPGLKVRDVIHNSPASRLRSRIEPGEILLAVNGREVDPDLDLTTVLNGRLDRNYELCVRPVTGDDRRVTIRPISYSAARDLLYEHWIHENRRQVHEASGGTLGYLHIAGMNMPSFYRFGRELYEVAHDKAGIIIDVRENGGGSTTDHLLTALTQPRHALTVPRNGEPGYPNDRMVYTSWHMPIVVICNQNSLSNAEIFSHAVKTLRRGTLVGVPTAGGVITTGLTQILDVGSLRTPWRGWYALDTGEDMELNGAVPDHIVWPWPGQMPRWHDVQLEKAIEVLQEEVRTVQERAPPQPLPASQRPRPDFD